MGLMSWLRGGRGGAARSDDVPAPAPMPAADRGERVDVNRLEPIQRVVSGQQLTVAPTEFEASLTTRQDTALGTPLGHLVSPDAPAGLVRGLGVGVGAGVADSAASPSSSVAAQRSVDMPVRGSVTHFGRAGGPEAVPGTVSAPGPVPVPVQRLYGGETSAMTSSAGAESGPGGGEELPVRRLVGERPVVAEPASPVPSPDPPPAPASGSVGVQRAAMPPAGERPRRAPGLGAPLPGLPPTAQRRAASGPEASGGEVPPSAPAVPGLSDDVGSGERTGPLPPCSVTIRWWGRCPGAVPMTWQGERLLLPVGRAMSAGQAMRVPPGVPVVPVVPVVLGVSCSGRTVRLPSPGRPPPCPPCLPRLPRLTAGPSPPSWATGPWSRGTSTYSAPRSRVPGPPGVRAGPGRVRLAPRGRTGPVDRGGGRGAAGRSRCLRGERAPGSAPCRTALRVPSAAGSRGASGAGLGGAFPAGFRQCAAAAFGRCRGGGGRGGAADGRRQCRLRGCARLRYFAAGRPAGIRSRRGRRGTAAARTRSRNGTGGRRGARAGLRNGDGERSRGCTEGRQGAPAVTDELVRALYAPLSRLLKNDLRLERERAGHLINTRH